MAPPEDDLLEQVDFSESTQAALEELKKPSEPRPETVDVIVQGALKTAAAETSTLVTEEDLRKEKFAAIAEKLGRPLTPEEQQAALTEWNEAMVAERLAGNDPKGWYALMAVLVKFIAPFVNLTSNAAIPNKAGMVQALNAEFRPELPSNDQVISWWLRDRDRAEQAKDILKRTGFTDQHIDMFMELGEVIPQAQDIVSFMVREVYNEKAREAFQLDEGFDRLYEDAEDDATRAGVGKETLRKFWQAHWRLPGINQAFEMLHRDQIDEPTLRLLLQAADIMPGFVDPLLAISFQPLTRVDIRRVADYLDKDSDWVKAQYKVLGYNETNAQVMADFTSAWINDKAEAEKRRKDKDRDKERDLTKSDIISLYKDGILVRADAKSFLETSGYDEDEADLYILRADMQNADALIKRRVATYKKAYVNSLWDRFKTAGLLDQLAIPSEYRETLLDQWDVDRELKIERPTKAEALGWLKKGLINEQKARDYLIALGYDTEFINLYIIGTIGE